MNVRYSIPPEVGTNLCREETSTRWLIQIISVTHISTTSWSKVSKSKSVTTAVRSQQFQNPESFYPQGWDKKRTHALEESGPSTALNPDILVSFPITRMEVRKVFTLAHRSRVQYIKAEKSKQKELKELGHVTSTIRKQRVMNTVGCSVPSVHLHYPGPQQSPASCPVQASWFAEIWVKSWQTLQPPRNHPPICFPCRESW